MCRIVGLEGWFVVKFIVMIDSARIVVENEATAIVSRVPILGTVGMTDRRVQSSKSSTGSSRRRIWPLLRLFRGNIDVTRHSNFIYLNLSKMTKFKHLAARTPRAKHCTWSLGSGQVRR